MIYTDGYAQGMFLEGTKQAHGLCRSVFKDGRVYEGMFLNDKRNGFGRSLWPNGNYYIGGYKDNKKSGPGKLVHADGTIEEGTWENNGLKGAEKSEKGEKNSQGAEIVS